MYNNLWDFFNGTPPTAALGGGALPPVQQTPTTPQGLMGPSGPAQLLPDPAMKQPSLMQRLQARFLPVPTGLKGLLSDEDTSSARHRAIMQFGLHMLAGARGAPGQNAPSLGASLLDSVNAGEGAFDQGLMGSAQTNMYGAQAQRQKAILDMRNRIGQSFAPQAGEPPQATFDRLRQMYGLYAQVGDTEMLGKLQDVMKELVSKTLEPHKGVSMNLGGTEALVDPETGQKITEYPKSPVPKDPNIPNFAQLNYDERKTQNDFMRESKLSDDYRTDVKPILEGTRAMKVLYTVEPAARAGDAQAQQSMLMAFIKMQHPTSTVRRNETLQAEEAKGLPDRVVQAWNQLTKGAVLAPRQIENIMNLAKGMHRTYLEQYSPIRAEYDDRAKQYGVKPIYTDPFMGLPALDGTPEVKPKGDAGKLGKYR